MSGKGLDSLVSEQHRLARRVVLSDGFCKLDTVAGVDQAFHDGKVISAIVVCSYKTMEVLEEVHSVSDVTFPYISSFLSYREAPAIIGTWGKLEKKPDISLIDGQGIAHQRGMGLASHVGVLLDTPSIGVAKSRLTGDFKKPAGPGKAEMLTSNGEQIGWVLVTKEGCNPLFISPGNKVSIRSSLRIVRECLRKHKLPEPVRLAHLHANAIKQSL